MLCYLKQEKAGYFDVSMELRFSNTSATWLALNNLLYDSDQMCFVLKEFVVCSCNMLFDFFVRYTILSGNIM